MTNRIDSVVDAAFTEAPKAPVEVVETTQPEVEVEVETQEPSEAQEEVSQETTNEREEFPKKAVNAITYRNKQIAKLKAELEATRAEVAAYKQPKQEILEDDYEDYGSFLKAQAKAEIKEELKQSGLLKEPTQATEYTPFEQNIAAQAQEFVKTVPDFVDVIELNSHILDAMPQRIIDLVAEESNIPKLVYDLANAGELELLVDMPTREAVKLIEKYTTAAKPEVKKQVTQAPAPIKAVSGTGSGSKSLDAMSGRELLAWVKN